MLARAATIQLEEAAAAHPRPPHSLVKGKGRAVPIRTERVVTTDLGLNTAQDARGTALAYESANKKASSSQNSASGLDDQFATITSELDSVSTTSERGPSASRAARISNERPPATIEASASESSTTLITDTVSGHPPPEPVQSPEPLSRSDAPPIPSETSAPAAAVEPDVSKGPSAEDVVPSMSEPPTSLTDEQDDVSDLCRLN